MLIQNIKGYKDLFKSKEEKKLKFVKAFEKLLNDPNTAQFSDGFFKAMVYIVIAFFLS